MTQRDALEAKMELIETKAQQMYAMVNVYQALGGDGSKLCEMQLQCIINF